VAKCAIIGVAMTLLACIGILQSGSRSDNRLTGRQMTAIRGMGAPCQWGYIDTDDPVLDCLFKFGKDNDCDAQGCTTTNCNNGHKYSGAMPLRYSVAGTHCDEEIDLSTSVGCYYDVTCSTGALQATRNCSGPNSPPSCQLPGGGPPTGCKVCSIFQEFPVTLVSKVDPGYKPCACASEE
jgi:hypothetical protein